MMPSTGPMRDIQQLQALLAVARELMQLDDAPAALALAGRAMIELAGADSALLLVRGEASESVGFDRTGMSRAVGGCHRLYPLALERLGSGGTFMPAARTMIVGVPTRQAMAVLAAHWRDDAEHAIWEERRRILETILALSAATLGRISMFGSLEGLVSTQYAQMADTARLHADELARRDEIDGDTRALSLTDVLTGLNNRRGFFVRAEHLFRLARRKHADCAVIHADVDDLKQVNGRLGHDTGDRLIQDAAALLQESLRGTDVLARLGGDAFIAFALDESQSRAILARLQDNLHAFNLMQERPYRLSLSVGVVRCDPDGEATLPDYVRQADRKMHLHKRRSLH